MNKKNGFFSSKKFRYGAVSYAITALVVVAVIVANVIFSNLAARFMWYSDMTTEELFTLSEPFKDVIDTVEDDVRIIFCSDPDELMGGTAYMNYIYQTALNLQAEYDNITVECHDVIVEYNFFEHYADTAASNIYTDSIIIESGTEFRLMAPEAFFIFDSEDTTQAWAYNGEKKFAAAILQVTSDEMPLVLFTESHGEVIGESASAFASLFSDAGFAVDTINLAAEEIPEDCRIIVINDPKYDFIGMEAESDSANEIAKLDTFLDGLGALMVFEDYDSADKLTNLNEFLEEWGIGFEYGSYLTDDAHSISVDGGTIVAEYEESGLGASIYTDISSLDTMPRTLIRNPMPVNILWQEDVAEHGSKQVWPVLSSYDTADLMVKGSVAEEGAFDLMAIARDRIIVNNENSINADYIYSYVLACGSPSFVSNEYLISNAYGNSDIIYATMRAIGRDYTLADLGYKAFDDIELNITTAQAQSWTTLFVVVPVLVIAICGTAVHIRRKNR